MKFVRKRTSKIIVIDLQNSTGIVDIHGEIRDALLHLPSGIDVECVLEKVAGERDFLELLRSIDCSKSSGLIIHIDGHASNSGVELNHGNETLSWRELLGELRRINRETDFGLLVNFSVCRGLSANMHIDIEDHAPYLATVGCAIDIRDYQVTEFYRDFYVNLFSETQSATNFVDEALAASRWHNEFAVLDARWYFEVGASGILCRNEEELLQGLLQRSKLMPEYSQLSEAQIRQYSEENNIRKSYIRTVERLAEKFFGLRDNPHRSAQLRVPELLDQIKSETAPKK